MQKNGVGISAKFRANEAGATEIVEGPLGRTTE